jgi:hypothetical protein
VSALKVKSLAVIEAFKIPNEKMICDSEKHCHKLHVVSVATFLNKCRIRNSNKSEVIYSLILTAFCHVCWFQYLLREITYLLTLWHLISHNVMLKMCNIRLTSWHLMAFLMHISFKFWSSAPPTRH